MTLRKTFDAWTWRWPAEQPATAVIPHRLSNDQHLGIREFALRQFVDVGELILKEPRHIPALIGWVEYSIKNEPDRGGRHNPPARIEFSEWDPGSVSWMRCQWTRLATVRLPCGNVRVPVPLDAPRPSQMPAWRRTTFLRHVLETAIAACKAALDPVMRELAAQMSEADRDMAIRPAILANLETPFGLIDRPVTCNLPDPSLARPGIMATDRLMTDPEISEIPVEGWNVRPRMARWRSLTIPESMENHMLVFLPPRLHFAMSEIENPISVIKALRSAS